MNGFQVVAAVVFVALLVLTYFAQIKDVVRKLLNRPSAPEVQPSIAVTLVNDIVAVTNLRDKLAAENCPEGVDACTHLLRVIVEHQQPAKGVV